MKILNHRVQGIPYKASPNTSGNLRELKWIIVHYDAASNSASAINWMTNPSSKVSAHFHIDRDGRVVQLVDLNRRAYHAGKSSWNGYIDLNWYTIGIELQNTGTQEYTQVQLDSLLGLCQLLVSEYPSIEDTLGHSDIAPGRKVDPGKQFPMDWLRRKVFLQQDIVDGVLVSKETTSDLNLRFGPGTEYKSLGVIKKGDKVNVISSRDGWSRVHVCSMEKTGWVSNNYIR